MLVALMTYGQRIIYYGNKKKIISKEKHLDTYNTEIRSRNLHIFSASATERERERERERFSITQ